MRWSGQKIGNDDANALPGLEQTSAIAGLLRVVETPEFAGVRFHEVLAKSALSRVPESSAMPFRWTINPYRGCTHACVYCFARPSHAWLDLDTGEGFDRDIVVKVNVVEMLSRELAKATWRREVVALGTNTDPYQRAEGRYQLMPGSLRALVERGPPASILTKGALVRRDLPLIAQLSKDVPISLAMSIAIHDETVAASSEPGAPTAAARLDTVRAAADLGLDVEVFIMPVLPYLTDTRAHLHRAAAAVRAAGAGSAVFSTLHLRPGVKGWFLDWLGREHPQLVARYEAMYCESAYAPRDYRDWLAAKAVPILRSHGLRGGEDPAEQPIPRARVAVGSFR